MYVNIYKISHKESLGFNNGKKILCTIYRVHVSKFNVLFEKRRRSLHHLSVLLAFNNNNIGIA